MVVVARLDSAGTVGWSALCLDITSGLASPSIVADHSRKLGRSDKAISDLAICVMQHHFYHIGYQHVTEANSDSREGKLESTFDGGATQSHERGGYGLGDIVTAIVGNSLPRNVPH